MVILSYLYVSIYFMTGYQCIDIFMVVIDILTFMNKYKLFHHFSSMAMSVSENSLTLVKMNSQLQLCGPKD